MHSECIHCYKVAIWTALEKVSVWQTISAQPEKHIIVFQAPMEMVPFVFDPLYCILLAFLIKGLGYAAGEGPFPCIVLIPLNIESECF